MILHRECYAGESKARVKRWVVMLLSFLKNSNLIICFEPQSIEQGIMNGKVNDKEQTLVIRNSLFDIRYSNNALSNQQHLILSTKVARF